jgi:DNA-directed RNA polymerase II subunit RPB2
MAEGIDAGIDFLSDDENRWNVNKSYLLGMGNIGPQISSYEHFVTTLLPEIIQEQSTIYVECESKRRCDTVSFAAPNGGWGCTVIRPTHTDRRGNHIDLSPEQAILMRTTYECGVRVDVHHTIEIFETNELLGEPLTREKKIYRNVPLFFFPCMVRSRFCHWNKTVDVDPGNAGGYFIIGGHEKCMIELQKMRTNYGVTRVLEFGEDKKSPKKTVAEVRASSEKWRSTSTTFVTANQIGGRERVSITLQVPFITKGSSLDIPLACIFKMLHVLDFETQIRYVLPDPSAVDPRVLDILRFTLREPKSTMTRDEVMMYLANEGTAQCRERNENKRLAYVEHIFGSEFFPHIGVSGISLKQPEVAQGGRWGGRMRAFRTKFDPEKIKEECRNKALFIGMVVNRLIHVHLRLLPEDDRDDYSNKRLDAPGPLLALHFRINFRAFLRQLPMALLKTIERCPSIIDVIKSKSKVITVNMREPFKKGNWSLQPGVNTGVVQAVPRMTPYTASAHMRRIMTALKKEGKIPTPRQLHLSQWGVNCCVETPEGQQCGLILCLALFAQVSTGIPTSKMKSLLHCLFSKDHGGNGLVNTDTEGMTSGDFIVLVNGSVFGLTKNPIMLEKTLVAMRRSADIPYQCRIVWYRHRPMSRYFFINTDGSVAVRPVYVVENLHKIVSVVRSTGTLPSLWTKFLNAGIVEFIDCEEQNSRELLVAVHSKDLRSGKAYTHLEIDPTVPLGFMAQLIPFSHMNQSPRNMYWSSMGKQAISMPCLAYKDRVDMHMFVMNYCQRSLVATRMDRFIVEQSGDIPTGASVIWAIACLKGENMEDSVYMKRQALERGLFHMTYYRTFVCETRSRGNEEEIFQIPPDTAVGRKGNANYSKLGPDGIVPEGTYVEEGDVLIGKIARMNDEFNEKGEQITRIHDRSIVMRRLSHGVVDKIIHTFTGFNGHNVCWVRIRQARIPVVGDKFASRHG